MGFFQRKVTSWNFVKNCVHFLKDNKDLMLYPIISLILCVALITLAATGGIAALFFSELSGESTVSLAIPSIIAFAGYFLLSFAVIYCNAALTICIIAAESPGLIICFEDNVNSSNSTCV